MLNIEVRYVFITRLGGKKREGRGCVELTWCSQLLCFLEIDQQFWCATWNTFEKFHFQWMRVDVCKQHRAPALPASVSCSSVLRMLHQVRLPSHLKPDDTEKEVENFPHHVQCTTYNTAAWIQPYVALSKPSKVAAMSCSQPFIWFASNTRMHARGMHRSIYNFHFTEILQKTVELWAQHKTTKRG